MERQRGRRNIQKNTTPAKVGETIVITRVFAAPSELVFKAWTEPGRIKRWWGPRDVIGGND